MPQSKRNFYNFTQEELAQYLAGLGKEKFRAQQIFKWVYQRRITNPELMTNLSKSFRADVAELFDFTLPEVVSHLKSVDGTQKFLFKMEGEKTVEAVLIPSDDRLTLCISSEVGCNMGCKFCYTGKINMTKRLSRAEIVGQFLVALDSLPPEQRITNIVFMGMGEPLDNPDGVFGAIKIFLDEWGLGLSRKKITVSTSGIVPMIPQVTSAGVRLAVSLNGSNDQIRTKVMPINNRWNIQELLEACRVHARESKDLITFEYVLLRGVTDSLEQARELYRLTRDVPCKINIIAFNEHPGSDFLRPSDEAVMRFHTELYRLGAHVLLRKTMGRDIYAACGQLTSKYEGRPERMNAATVAALN